ncbi:hypothetical protein VTL71DRAFT_11515 [Oculimacula yallundae]|uniref:Uncharacterized protein n=1 Tax=Oculimacula yallundae TaxID=86028 RepID=A0ABR4CQA6_9HELO
MTAIPSHSEVAQTTAASTTESPTPMTTSSLSSESQKTMLLGAVIGGVGALLLLSVLTVCCMQQRKKRRARKSEHGPKQMTYTGINSRFQGVSFRDSSSSSMSPRPLLLSHSSTTFSGTLSPGQRPNEMDGFLYNPHRDAGSPQQSPQPSPQSWPQPSPHIWPPHSPSHPYQSPHSRSISQTIPNSHSRTLSDARLRSASNAHYRSRSRSHSNAQSRSYPHALSRSHSSAEENGSPLTLNDPSEAHVLSGYGLPSPPRPTELEAPKPPVRDTMGFPVEQTAILDEIRLLTMTPVLQAPRPTRPLAHQDSLERLARENNLVSSPVPSNSVPQRSRVISQEFRESPVLGVLSPVKIQHPTVTRLGGGLRRNDSQRSLASESTMGPLVGDEELEKLGVGARPQPLRLRDL